MLKKRNRLTTKEFKNIFNKQQKKFSKNLLLIEEEENIFEPKIAVAISKKIEKKAVNRVKSRRIIYKILKDNFSEIDFKKQIILITKPILNKNLEELKKELFNLFKLKIEN